MLHRYRYCNTEKDVLSGLYLHDQAPQIRLIRGSGTRYVAVVVPLAKLGLTKCPEARRALELQLHLIHKYELQLQTYILKYDLITTGSRQRFQSPTI